VGIRGVADQPADATRTLSGMARSIHGAPAATGAAILVGLLVAGQSRINAALARSLADAPATSATAAGFQAALISFVTGLLLLAIGLAVVPPIRRGMVRIASTVRAGGLRPWQLLGGAGGAWLVATQGLTVPTLGVALFIVAVVAGQTAASLGVDAAGLGPTGRLPITRYRVVAAVLAVVAVALTAAPRIETAAGSRALLLAALVVTAGAGIAVQQALNARVAVSAGYAPSAAVVNFVVGATVLALAMAVGIALAGWHAGAPPSNPFLYVGGPMGVAFIAIAAWAVPLLGVLRFGLAAISGQLAGGAIIDLLFPQPGVVVGAEIVVGIGLTLVAVVIGNRR
jgi:transporter family-2 protein